MTKVNFSAPWLQLLHQAARQFGVGVAKVRGIPGAFSLVTFVTKNLKVRRIEPHVPMGMERVNVVDDDPHRVSRHVEMFAACAA